MTLLARESYSKGPAGEPIDAADTVHAAQVGVAAVYAPSPVDGGFAARRSAADGSGFLRFLTGTRSALVHSWYVTFDDGTTTAGNAVLSSVISGTTFRGEVTRRATGTLGLREVQSLRTETTAAYGPGTYRLVHAIDGATQSLTVRRAADDVVLETISAPFGAGGFDRTHDGFVNAPGGTLVMLTDQHAWDTTADPGPYAAPSPSAPSWTYRAGGIDRPVESVVYRAGGVERLLTTTTVRNGT
ncbi:hypothetical protein WDZ16_12880 [Pseudokineococcus marinus]|uniref:Uncharacterized protein n=1 Tax=Pseudokineococcus marinus TaxID=351215 RepID=A0A849BEZ9_9ACTN|nr:hypothetical protein [Pseudokineococcus marinus]NNH21629.1 hypothetical protein [Pseudokineococcus marinus]